MNRPRFFVPLLLAVGAACSNDAAGPDSGEPLDDQALVTLFGGMQGTGTNGTRACPAGGEIAVEHAADLAIDGDMATIEFEATIEHRGCTHVVDGDPMISDGHITYRGVQRAHREEDGRMRPLESTTHQTGRMRIRYRDYDQTCDIDLTQTLDVAREEIRIRGTHCGREIDVKLSGPLPQLTGA